MDTAECKELIVTSLALRGKGTADPFSPSRRITQVFEKDGVLVAEADPLGSMGLEEALRFGRLCQQNPEGDLIELLKEMNIFHY